MNDNSLITSICELLKIICPLLITGGFGYRLGLLAKKPVVVVDHVTIKEGATCAQLNNIGTSPAIDVTVDDCILVFDSKHGRPFYEQLKDMKVVLKFEKAKYIEPSKPMEVRVGATINGKPVTKEGLFFHSFSLDKFKNVSIQYKDNFGIRYKSKIEHLDIKNR